MTLHAVSDEPQPEASPGQKSLLQAVESGNVLEMLLAQRRLIAEALVSAADNTRPQYNNELNKLHTLIAAEQERLKAVEVEATEDKGGTPDGGAQPKPFDPSTV